MHDVESTREAELQAFWDKHPELKQDEEPDLIPKEFALRPNIDVRFPVGSTQWCLAMNQAPPQIRVMEEVESEEEILDTLRSFGYY